MPNLLPTLPRRMLSSPIDSNVDASDAFAALVRGRRVALVGPSKSILGSRLGGEIDAFDLVVRMNHQWPYHETLAPDLGHRMDIIYHCCNPDFPIERIFCPEFSRIRCVCFEAGVQSEPLLAECRRKSILALEVSGIYSALRAELDTFPNTGLVAITHLLRQDLSQLKLFGLSFFREAYYEGYLGCGAEPQNWRSDGAPRRIWQHDLDLQYEKFLRIHSSDKRLFVDHRCRSLFDEELQNDERYRHSEWR